MKYSCMHCQKPSCVSVCPVFGHDKDKITGIVDYNKNTCIGCRYCQDRLRLQYSQVPVGKGDPADCEMRPLQEHQLKQKGISACAEVCPTGAIMFGKRKDLLAEPKKRLASIPSSMSTISTVA